MLTCIAWKMTSMGHGGSQKHVKLQSGVLARLTHVYMSGVKMLGILPACGTCYRVRSYRVVVV